MKTKRVVAGLVALLFATVGLWSCDSLLGEEEGVGGLSNLTKDVEFVATSVIAKHNTNSIINNESCENFFLEFVGANRAGGFKDVIMLDLLAPRGAESLVGEYVVGYEGDYVALSRYDFVDQSTGSLFVGGSMYAEAKNNYLTDYFGYLTKGEVTITQSADGSYNVIVDAKSVYRTIKMTYTGKIELRVEN